MNSREREEFREVILGEIEPQKHQIESLLKSIKPIKPDNADRTPYSDGIHWK